MTVLEAKERDAAVAAKTIRANKRIPCVFYTDGKEATSLDVDYEEFRKLYRQAGGNTIVDLKIGGKATKVLIHDVQMDPVYDTYIHVDFYGVKMKEEITADIPLEFVGESPAVKNLAGLFITNRDQLSVKCLPTALVSHIEVDISVLAELGDVIRLDELNIPEGMEVQEEENITIALVQAPKKVEEEEVDIAEVDPAAVEVVTEKKEESTEE